MIKSIALLCLMATSCAFINNTAQKLQEPEEYYKRASFLHDSNRPQYNAKDSIVFGGYVFCAQSGEDRPQKVRKKHVLTQSEITSSLDRAFTKAGVDIGYSQNVERFETDNHCSANLSTRQKKALSILVEASRTIQTKQLTLLATIDYGAYWSEEFESEPPVGYLPTGNRFYRINRSLTLALFENDTLAYADSYFHRDTTVIKEFDTLAYSFPQEIMDSLAVLTMQGYKERLRP